MNLIEFLDRREFEPILVVLAHFIWQGCLIALIWRFGFSLLKDRWVEIRYLWSLTGLVAMLAAPIVTMVWVHNTRSDELTRTNIPIASSAIMSEKADDVTAEPRDLITLNGTEAESLTPIAGVDTDHGEDASIDFAEGSNLSDSTNQNELIQQADSLSAPAHSDNRHEEYVANVPPVVPGNGRSLPESEVTHQLTETFEQSSSTDANAESGWIVPGIQQLRRWMIDRQAFLLLIWMVGVLILTGKLCLGWVGCRRLVGSAEMLPNDVEMRVRRLTKTLGIRSDRCLVWASSRVSQAIAVGFVRPVVLVPLGWLHQLPPHVMDAVLAHELAHLRRLDLPVNLVQRVMESVFFFHPAVWWMSNQVRFERECCCDRLAAKATGDRAAFARALAEIAQLDIGRSPMGLVASFLGEKKMTLLDRVHRVLGTPRQKASRRVSSLLTVLVVAAVTTVMAVSMITAQESERQERRRQNRDQRDPEQMTDQQQQPPRARRDGRQGNGRQRRGDRQNDQVQRDRQPGNSRVADPQPMDRPPENSNGRQWNQRSDRTDADPFGQPDNAPSSRQRPTDRSIANSQDPFGPNDGPRMTNSDRNDPFGNQMRNDQQSSGNSPFEDANRSNQRSGNNNFTQRNPYANDDVFDPRQNQFRRDPAANRQGTNQFTEDPNGPFDQPNQSRQTFRDTQDDRSYNSFQRRASNQPNGSSSPNEPRDDSFANNRNMNESSRNYGGNNFQTPQNQIARNPNENQFYRDQDYSNREAEMLNLMREMHSEIRELRREVEDLRNRMHSQERSSREPDVRRPQYAPDAPSSGQSQNPNRYQRREAYQDDPNVEPDVRRDPRNAPDYQRRPAQSFQYDEPPADRTPRSYNQAAPRSDSDPANTRPSYRSRNSAPTDPVEADRTPTRSRTTVSENPLNEGTSANESSTNPERSSRTSRDSIRSTTNSGSRTATEPDTDPTDSSLNESSIQYRGDSIADTLANSATIQPSVDTTANSTTNLSSPVDTALPNRQSDSTTDTLPNDVDDRSTGETAAADNVGTSTADNVDSSTDDNVDTSTGDNVDTSTGDNVDTSTGDNVDTSISDADAGTDDTDPDSTNSGTTDDTADSTADGTDTAQ